MTPSTETRCFRRRLALQLALLTMATLCIPGASFAQESPADAPSTEEAVEPDTLPQPLLVVSVASVDRIVDDVRFVLESIERPDVWDVVTGLLASANDLEGLDSTKPLGMMLFLKPGLLPSPVPIFYVPVVDVDALIETAALGNIRVETVDSLTGHYEIRGPFGIMPARHQGNYVFIAEDELILDREFPDPVELTKAQVAQFDISAKLDLMSVPEGMKTLLLSFMKAAVQSELQQRDDEPAASYRARKAYGDSTYALLEQVAQHGETVTIGLDVSRESGSAIIDVAIAVKPDSPLDEYLRDMPGGRSRFSALLDESTPLFGALCWKLAERDKKMIAETVSLIESNFQRSFPAKVTEDVADEDEPDAPVRDDLALSDIFEPLKATVEGGELDAFVKITGKPKPGFSVIGGMRVAEGARVAAGLRNFLPRLRDVSPTIDVELNAAVHRDVSLNKFSNKAPIYGGLSMFFGSSPTFWVGAGSHTVWFAVGGEEALDTLKQAMDTVAEPPTTSEDLAAPPPLRVTINVGEWFAAIDQEVTVGNQGAADLGREAFTPENDRIAIDLRPSEDGARLRVELEMGLIRFMVLQWVQQYDRSQL